MGAKSWWDWVPWEKITNVVSSVGKGVSSTVGFVTSGVVAVSGGLLASGIPQAYATKTLALATPLVATTGVVVVGGIMAIGGCAALALGMYSMCRN